MLQVQTLARHDAETTIVRGLAAYFREQYGAAVEERPSVVAFSHANLEMAWLLTSPVIASEGEIVVFSFGALTTLSYQVRLRASAVRLAAVLGVIGASVALAVSSPLPAWIPGVVAAAFGYGYVFKMLPHSAGFFENRLRTIASSTSYGGEGSAPA
jgi:hypothetical protein